MSGFLVGLPGSFKVSRVEPLVASRPAVGSGDEVTRRPPARHLAIVSGRASRREGEEATGTTVATAASRVSGRPATQFAHCPDSSIDKSNAFVAKVVAGFAGSLLPEGDRDV